MEISGCWRTRDVVGELINASTHVEDKHYLPAMPGRKLCREKYAINSFCPR